MKRIAAIAVATALVSAPAIAEMDNSKLYVGGGLSMDKTDIRGGDNEIGFHGFGGMDFLEKDQLTLSAEAGLRIVKVSASACGFGFCASASENATILYGAAVGKYAFTEEFSALGRLGLNIIDDSGIVFGVGGQYDINDQLGARLEYQMGPDLNSIMLSAVYHLGN